jgi:hypothetical protein
MARVTCRCGEVLKVPAGGGPERIDCPRCGARIRLRRPASPSGSVVEMGETEGGYIRFRCPCGRRLKVVAADRPAAGKCPDCGRVVPVPASAWSDPAPGGKSGWTDPDARTEDLDQDDLARLEQWAARHAGRSSRPAGREATPPGLPAVSVPEVGSALPDLPPSMVKFEAGLRVCPRCGKPVHMSATTCRECGSPVPRR